jgi:hypothetical protein
MCTPKKVSALVIDLATCTKFATFTRLDKLGHSIDCHACIDCCESNLLFLRSVAPHFPEVRNVVKTLYALRRCNKELRNLDFAIKRHDVVTLSAMAGEAESNANAFFHESCQNELSEVAIMATYKNAFKAFTKSSLDTPKYDCISCEKLCFK